MKQLEIPLDDERKTLRTYKWKPRRVTKGQRGPLKDAKGNDVAMNDKHLRKWAALKQTGWFASLRAHGALEGK